MGQNREDRDGRGEEEMKEKLLRKKLQNKRNSSSNVRRQSSRDSEGGNGRSSRGRDDNNFDEFGRSITKDEKGSGRGRGDNKRSDTRDNKSNGACLVEKIARPGIQ